MDQRGMMPADLARATGIHPATLHSIITGKVGTPQKEQRDALDAVLAPQVPGTTTRICNERATSYPTDDLLRFCSLAQQAPTEVLPHLAALAATDRRRGVAGASTGTTMPSANAMRFRILDVARESLLGARPGDRLGRCHRCRAPLMNSSIRPCNLYARQNAWMLRS